MTLLKFFNYFIFQWFFFRLAKYVDERGNLRGWSIIYYIVPCTGWETNFKTLGKFHIQPIIKWRNYYYD